MILTFNIKKKTWVITHVKQKSKHKDYNEQHTGPTLTENKKGSNKDIKRKHLFDQMKLTESFDYK